MCITDHSRKWHSENKEAVAASQKKWRDSRPKNPPKQRTRTPRSIILLRYRLKKKGFPNANLSIKCLPVDPQVRWAIYYEANKDKIAEMQRRYREANKAKLQLAWGEWYRKNAAQQVQRAAERRKRVMTAMPTWLSIPDRMRIANIYELATAKTQETGIEHWVDHMVPIAGKSVCGLHVPWNLRVITKLENIRKSNKLDPLLGIA